MTGVPVFPAFHGNCGKNGDPSGHILHVSARPHETNRIMAVNEPKSTPGFMHHYLGEPFGSSVLFIGGRKAHCEAGKGKRCLFCHLMGLSENIRQDGMYRSI